jgi:hypothetical protein
VNSAIAPWLLRLALLMAGGEVLLARPHGIPMALASVVVAVVLAGYLLGFAVLRTLHWTKACLSELVEILALSESLRIAIRRYRARRRHRRTTDTGCGLPTTRQR